MTVLYEDKWLIVCRKEPGVLSQPKEGAAGGDDMLSRLARLFEERGEATVPYPVHRLDRPTGGVMVFAKSAAAAASLSRAAAGDGMKKEYLAVTEGTPATESGELCDLLFFDRGKDKTYVVKRLRRGVHEARLSYETVAVRPADALCARPLTLLRVRLGTGRTHQIRAQLAARHLPLYGDARYGAATRGPLGLFAASLSFPHPQDGRPLTFTAEVLQELPFSLFEQNADSPV